MEIINKIKNKNNLPIIFLILMILRFLPLISVNAFSKLPVELSNGMPGRICLIIELVAIIVFFALNIKNIKIDKKIIIFFILFSFLFGIVEIKDILKGEFYFKDISNIACMSLNIILFYILIYDFKIDEKSIVIFLKGIIWFAVIAIAWNFILFFYEILLGVGIMFDGVKYLGLDNPKGFFSNRNTLAFFIFLATVANSILINFPETKKWYKYIFVILFLGMWCTDSKTGFICLTAFLELYIFLNSKIDIRKRICICFIIAVLSLLGLLNIMGRFPKVADISALVISEERIQNLSNRSAIWKKAFEVLDDSSLNYILGIGKYNSLENIKDVGGIKYDSYHNLYIEFLVVGGVLELIYISIIFCTVIIKILKSNLEKIFKIIYLDMYLVYCIYIMFESFGRFSTAPIDFVCLIFFISIPLLHSNSNKIEKKMLMEGE